MRGVTGRMFGLVAALLAAGAATAQAPVERVPIDGSAPIADRLNVRVRQSDGRRCVPAGRISAAVVTSDHAIELTMKGGARYRLQLATHCPQIGYYSGFYFKRRALGKLCAGADRIMARSGGECVIAGLVPMRPAGPPRGR